MAPVARGTPTLYLIGYKTLQNKAFRTRTGIGDEMGDYRLKRSIDTEINLSWFEIAQAFWCLDDHEQAQFFNELARISSRHNLLMQLTFVSASKELSDEGREVMATIGEYAKKPQ